MDTYRAQLDAQWAKLTRTAKLDWMGYERMAVAILKDTSLTAEQQVSLCREALDAFTGSGHFAGTLSEY